MILREHMYPLPLKVVAPITASAVWQKNSLQLTKTGLYRYNIFAHF